jgi:glycosyltransferase involved in cell wall biosynthesis
MPRHGGGTFQLTENVMCALKDYAETRGTSRIHLFFSARQAEELGEIKSKFPNFLLNRISKPIMVYSAVLRRVFSAVPPLVYGLRYLYSLNWIARQQHIDLMIFPGITFDASFYRGRRITLFTDIAHVFYPQFPELAADGELRRRNILFKYGVRYANQIVVESEQLQNDTVKYYGADPTKIAILHQTVSQTLVALETQVEDEESLEFKRALPKRYFFYPAQLWEHKNHKNLLYALEILTAEYPDLQLILVGSRKPGDQKIFDLIDSLGLNENVKWMGYVPDAFIRILYKNACALVKPGYIGPTNIPTLEAFYYGCPAVITDLPGVREQTADAALLFDPDSPQDIAAKMRMVLNDEVVRHNLVKNGYERLKVLGYESYKNTFFAILDKNLNIRQDQ